MSAPVLAVDIGGTKLAAAVVAADGELLTQGVRPTDQSLTGEGLYQSLLALLRDVRGTHEFAAVGVGCGGPMDDFGQRVSPLNIPAWRDFPLAERLATDFGVPCKVDNDAKALVLGERWMGAGQGSRNLLSMVVSTGVGAGVVLDGRLLHGQAGNAGHLGHIIVVPDGPMCGCGARGCVEAVASGSGLSRQVRELQAAGQALDLPVGATGRQLAEAARAGHPVARQFLETAGTAVGRGIASAAALLDLELVTVGGGLALGAWDLIGPSLLATVEREARLDFTRGLRVERSTLGDRGGLIGAAALAFEMPHSADPRVGDAGSSPS